MEIIFQNQYIKYVLEKENSIIEFFWLKETKKMSSDNFKEAMLKGEELAKKHKVKYIINNSIEKEFVATVELQEWLGKNVLAKLFADDVIKLATIESEDVLIKLSTQQAVEEGEGMGFAIKFFGNEEDAREWLFQE